MTSNLLGYGVQLLVVLVVMLGVYAVLRGSLRTLLDEVLRVPAGTTFYLRSLLLLLLFAGLQKAVGDEFAHEAGTAWMVYVWDVADTVGAALETSAWVFILYLVQITILAATLRRK